MFLITFESVTLSLNFFIANLRLVKELEVEYPEIELSVYKADKNMFKNIEKIKK